jgi:hypothetical protein
MVQLLREWVDLDNQPLAMTTPHRSTRQGFAHNSGHYRPVAAAATGVKGENRPKAGIAPAYEKARRGAGLIFSEERFPLEVGNATEMES